MYNNLQLARKYVHYYINAFNGKGHGMHSPFVFNFIQHVLNGGNEKDLEDIEALRKSLLRNRNMLQITDLGAGSRSAKVSRRSVKQIAASALKPPRLATILYRLSKFYKPDVVIELGTSLGITTSCFSRALPQSTIISIEGSGPVAAVANENFQKLGCKNIQVLEGNFDDVLKPLLDRIPLVDLAYIDGNHRYEPTIRYFHWFLEKSDEHTIMVFDDIHWSFEMEKAWEEIKAHPSVRYTIDIFFLGFVFFREEFKVKQHFLIRS